MMKRLFFYYSDNTLVFICTTLKAFFWHSSDFIATLYLLVLLTSKYTFGALRPNYSYPFVMAHEHYFLYTNVRHYKLNIKMLKEATSYKLSDITQMFFYSRPQFNFLTRLNQISLTKYKYWQGLYTVTLNKQKNTSCICRTFTLNSVYWKFSGVSRSS